MRINFDAKPAGAPGSSGPGPYPVIRRLSLALAALVIAGAWSADPTAASDAATGRFRIPFSPGMFTEEFFGSVAPATKPSQAALPVVLRKADACVMTRSAYATLCELNPQIEKKLNTLESSKELVPAVFALCGNYHPPFKNKLLTALQSRHEPPAGQQVLTVFPADRLEQMPESALQISMDIIRQHRAEEGSPAKASAAARALVSKEKERRTP